MNSPWPDLARRVLDLRSEHQTDLSTSVMRVPATDYTSTEMLNAELDRLFWGGPVLAGLSGAASDIGSWFTIDISGVSVLIVRTETGLRAYRNACPHRGLRLLEGSGDGLRRITCPFHAWSFDTLGINRGIPMRDAFDQYDPAELDLVSVHTFEINGLIFVSLKSPSEQSGPENFLGGMAPELAAFGVAGQGLLDRKERQLRMNWKLGVDSYMEAYHLHYLHKDSLRRFFHNDASPFDAFGRHGRIGGVRQSIDTADRDLLSSDDELLNHITLEYQIFPNAVLILQQDHVELSQVFPDPTDPGLTTVVQSVYGPSAGLTDELRARYVKSFSLLLDITITEDFSACERIQQNLKAGSPTHLRLGRNEPGVVHFHQQLHDALGNVATS